MKKKRITHIVQTNSMRTLCGIRLGEIDPIDEIEEGRRAYHKLTCKACRQKLKQQDIELNARAGIKLDS